MDRLKNAVIAALVAVAIVVPLALLCPPLREYILGFVISVPFGIGILVVLVGVGSVTIAYGFGQDDNSARFTLDRPDGRKQR